MSGNYSQKIKNAEINFVNSITMLSKYPEFKDPQKKDYIESVNRPYLVKTRVFKRFKWIKSSKWRDKWVDEVNEDKFKKAVDAYNDNVAAKTTLSKNVTDSQKTLSDAYEKASEHERSEIFLTHFLSQNPSSIILNELKSCNINVETVLNYAISNGLDKTVSLLLSKDASLVDDNGVLISALTTDNEKIINIVIKHISIDDTILKLCDQGLTPEIQAALIQLVESKSDSVGLPIILKLAEFGKIDAVKLILTHSENAKDTYLQAVSLAYSKDMKNAADNLEHISIEENGFITITGDNIDIIVES